MASNEVEPFLLWERHLAAMIVAGSHSHKGDTSLPTGRRSAPYPAFYEFINVWFVREMLHTTNSGGLPALPSLLY